MSVQAGRLASTVQLERNAFHASSRLSSDHPGSSLKVAGTNVACLVRKPTPPSASARVLPPVSRFGAGSLFALACRVVEAAAVAADASSICVSTASDIAPQSVTVQLAKRVGPENISRPGGTAV